MDKSRRIFLQQLFASGAAFSVIQQANAGLLEGRLFNPCGRDLPHSLAEHPVLSSAWDGIDQAKLWDAHAHIAGTGDSGTGIYISPQMNSLWHPIQYTQFKFYLNAACIDKVEVDHSYIERLKHLIQELNHTAIASKASAASHSEANNKDVLSHAKLMLFAFDQAYDEAGHAQEFNTAFHVPNVVAQQTALNFPQYFEWVCSIHPYRDNAIDALEEAAASGARAVKWLPSAMGIDPASEKCDAFYCRLAQLDFPLICHAGEEKAVDGMGFHHANNPLKMRRAMDAGVRVVIAHCASIGEDVDLDKGEHGPYVSSFELFSRLMDNDQYQHQLFADISAITQRNRPVETLRNIIEHQDWHHRLLNGSDYPLPGVLPLFTTGKLAKAGLLDPDVVPVIDALQHYNPLLFDFVLKRHLRSGTQKLSDNIFHTRNFFQRSTI
jgi:uncharacterized protein